MAGGDRSAAAGRERLTDSRVVVLAGGTGGAKLARGMLDVVGPDRLAVIANTGDDIDIYGAHVSPDPDLISFWLGDRVDQRGWGIAGDTFNVMDALRELGVDVWFNLGDRDLAWCLERRRLRDEGFTATDALRVLNERIGVRARVLPMCDAQLRTFVNGVSLQEFLIRQRGAGPIHEVRFAGADDAPHTAIEPTPQAREALAGADAVIIGPSNPVISIWPILSVLGEALLKADAPVVAVSPIVDGQVLKGPTDVFMDALRLPASAAGVVAYYESLYAGLLDGVVADEPVPAGAPLDAPADAALRVVSRFGATIAAPDGRASATEAGRERVVPQGLATLQIDTEMPDAAARQRVAEQTLRFALSLRS